VSHKVLLINVNTCSTPYPVFPLGLGHLASSLEASGYRTHLLDLAVYPNDLEDILRRQKPDIVGLSLRNIDDIHIENTQFYAPALTDITKRIRALTDAAVVLGGSGYSLFPEALLKATGADFGIAGEGECALPALLDALAAGNGHEHIPGIVYSVDGSVVVNRKRACAVDAILTPAMPRRLAAYYIQTSSMLNIQTQRGCGYKCSYCTYPLIEGTRFRRRSPQSVCDDIRAAQRAGARYVFIVDSVFNTSRSHVVALCEEILRRRLRIKWGCFLRPKGLTQSLMNLMARAGLTHIEFGSDSLCDSVLEAYGKGFTFGDVLHASECARMAGVHFAHFLIVGGPTETEKTVREGFANSTCIKRTVFFPFVGVRLYPDTPLHAWALSEGTVARDADLLKPYFYVTPHISREKIFRMLSLFSAQALNWVVSDVSVQNSGVMRALRQKGIVGPLWEYLIR